MWRMIHKTYIHRTRSLFIIRCIIAVTFELYSGQITLQKLYFTINSMNIIYTVILHNMITIDETAFKEHT